MKKFTRTGKKVLSVFLAALMVMTAWVFVAPTKAEAISGGNYYVTITWNLDNRRDGGIPNEYNGKDKLAGKGKDSGDNNCAGISLFFKRNNGTGTTGEVYWSFGKDEVNTTGNVNASDATVYQSTGVITGTEGADYELKAIIPGFPTGLYAFLDNNHVTRFVEYDVKSIKVGSSFEEKDMTTIWAGKIHLSSHLNADYGMLNSDYSFTESKDATCKDVTVKNWNYPYANKIVWNSSTNPANVTIPDNDTTVTRTVKSHCEDQYGVTLATGTSSPYTFSYPDMTGITTSHTDGTSDATFTVTVGKGALMSKQGENVRKATITAKYTFNGKTVSTPTKTFNISDPKYRITFNGNSGSVSPTYYDVYYGESLKSQATLDSKSTYPVAGTRTGYTWLGMFDAQTGGNLMNTEEVVTAAKTYWAHWDKNLYTVVFLNRKGEYVDVQYIYHGDDADSHSPASKLPKVEYDSANHYTLNESAPWSPAVNNVTENIITKAQYTAGEHDFDNGVAVAATCHSGAGTKYTCEVCGYSYIKNETSDRTAHTFGDAVTVTKEPTCTTAGEGYKTCTVCGAHSDTVTVAATGHSYKIEKKDATCAAEGSIKYTCTKCGETHTDTLPKTAHTMQAGTTVAATCTSAAYTPYKCSACNYSYNVYDASQPAIGHSWGAWTVSKAATNTADGEMKRTCSKNSTHVETVVIPKGDHAFGTTPTSETPATCHSTGTQVFKCTKHTNCGVQITVTTAKTAHNFNTTINDADCTTAGSVVTKCQNTGCTETITTVIPATGHNYDSSSVTKEATCAEAGVRTYTCSKCGTTKTETIAKLEHKFVETPATCIADGSKKCALCGYTETIAKTGHQLGGWEALKAATCAGNGIEVQKCTVCGQIQNVRAVEKLTTHSWSDWSTYQDATCTSDRVEQRTCSVCEKIEIQSVPGTKGHEWSEDFITDYAATCISAGQKSKHCSRCDAKTEVTEIPALGHELSTTITKATCTTSGKTIDKCSRCDYEKTTITQEALGHDFSVETEDKTTSTCNEIGYTVYKCSRCDETEKVYSDKLGEHTWGSWEVAQEQTDVLPKIEVRKCETCGLYDYKYTAPTGAHEWNDGVVTKEPTCTEEGVKTFTCIGEHCTCIEGKRESYTVPVPATGHNVVTEIAVAATCTTDGKTAKVYCDKCDKVYLESETVAALGHRYEVKSVENATCQSPAKVTLECSVCHVEKINFEATNGSHSYTVRSAENDISATCTTDGYEAYKCAYCDDIKYVKSETEKATGHKVDETKTKTKPATCSEPGKIEKYCSCGQLLEVTVTNPDAAKHDFSKTVTVNASEGCLKSGYSYKVCSVCGAVDKSSISVKDASDHKYKYVVDEAATCSEKGSAHFECETCETPLPSIELPMIQHTYGEGVETKKATCTEKGKVEFTCTVCGNKLTAETETTGHEYVAGEITPATCSKSGWQTYKCKNCDDSYNVITEGPLANHKYVLTSTKETCTVSGTYKYECSDCRASYEYTVPATGHNYNELLENKPSTCKEIGYKKYKCSNDGCTAETIVYESTLAEHSFGDWETVTEPTTDKAGLKIQTCSVCGLAKKETVSPIGDHSFVTGTADGDYKAPTCTEDGYQKMYCTKHEDCSANYDVVLPATGHTSVNDEAVPATCTSEGKTAGSHCSVCNEVIVAQQTIPAKNHNYSNTPTAYTAATCQKEGSVTLKCTDCDHEMTVTIKKNSDAHKMVVDAENSQIATCKQAAYTAYKCANEGCEHTYKVLTSNPTPHTEKSEWEVVESATCASAGYKVKKCKDCDAILETQAIPADSDSHKYTKMTVEGSHFKSGYTYDLCLECGKIANIELSETEKHSYDTLVEKVDATAYENGYAIYECECKDRITVLLPKEGCDYTSKVTKQPTCTEKGETTYTCTVHADEEPIVKADIPALGHENGTPEIKQATCTEKGYVKVVCAREGCDEVLINEETDLINHTFSTSYTSYKPSTCLEEGKVTYKCLNDNCDATITVTLPKAQHNYETSEEMTEPTCLSGGYITFKCTTKGCDSEYYEVVENATGHKFTKEDTERYVAPTCSEVGHKYFVCAVCGAEGYDYEVPATGEHNYNVPVSVPADCENAGYSYNECECGAIDKTSLRSINPLGHSYTVKVDENTMKCSRCDSTITVQKSVTDEEGVVHALVATVIKESTCTVPGEVVYTCRNHTDCEQNKTEELPLAEHAANAKSVVTVNPVCKKDGSTVDGYVLIKCASCDSEIERITIAASHKYVVKDIERSTCSSNGKVIEECSECGHKRETEIKMNLAAHDFSGAPTKSVSATCTTEGYAVYTCRNEGCGVQKFIVTAPAIGHKNTKKETKDATCEADGYERTICTDCKIVLKETVKKATGHKEYEVVTVEPTCEKAGSKTTKCAKCGEIIKVEVLDPTGHTWGEWKNNGDNVSCEVGGTASRECTVCHKTEVKTLPKGEHTYDEGVVTPATCTENGYTTYTCTKCGHSYVANYTPMRNHNYSGSFVVIIEPTCHSTGSKVQKCIYCGDTNPDSADHNYNNIPRLDHNYGEWEVIEGATCDRNGLRQRTCMNEGCPEGYDGHVQKEVISKIGHNYGEWTVTKEANCSETGEKQRVCDRCGGIETAEISKGRHKIVVDKAVEATCVSTGLTAGNHCGICGKILVAQEVIPMKSHVDFDGNGRCDKCDSVTYEPSHDDTCLCHGTGFRAFLYKIVLIFWKLFRVRQTCVCGVKHWE